MKKIKSLIAIVGLSLLSACGGGGDGGGDSSGGKIPGGVCIGSGSSFICQGRVCTKSGSGVICPDGQYCPMSENLSVTSNPVCAARGGS